MPEVLTTVVIISSCADVVNVKSVVNNDSVDSYSFTEVEDWSRSIDVEKVLVVVSISMGEE